MTTVSVSSARSVPGPGARTEGAGLSLGMLASASAALVLITAMFWTFLAKQARHSWATEDWSHSFFVPLISLYLLYQSRAQLRAAARGAGVFVPGLVPMLLGMVIYPFFLIGYPNHMGQGWAWVLTLYGATLLFLGPRLAAVALLPIAYLVMGVTISERVMVNATFQLQLLASQGAYVLLNVIGVTTDVRGNVLEVHTSTGIEQLNVAEACSGMRLVIAFVALGVAVALAGLRHWWQRVVLILSAVPVALGLNIVRVAVLGVLTLSDPEYARGGAHMLIGTVLLVPGFLIFMSLAWALSKVIREPRAVPAGPGAASPLPRSSGPLSPPARAGHRGGQGVGAWAGLGALSVGVLLTHTVVAALGYTLTKLPIDPPGGRVVASLPSETRSWLQVGSDEKLSTEVVATLGTENFVTRTYVQKGPAAGATPVRVQLHVAYYTGKVDTVPHVPERCLTGGGWSLVGGDKVVPLGLDDSTWLPLRGDDGAERPGLMTARPDASFGDSGGVRVVLPRSPGSLAARVSQFEWPGSPKRLWGGYFFVANGGHTPSANDVRLLAFQLEDTYAYYMKVQVSTEDAKSEEEFARVMSSIIGELLPELMRCVPDWAEVEAGRYPVVKTARSAGVAGGA